MGRIFILISQIEGLKAEQVRSFIQYVPESSLLKKMIKNFLNLLLYNNKKLPLNEKNKAINIKTNNLPLYVTHQNVVQGSAI